jgi:LysR family transcriptional activator of nhaA
MFNYNHLYYFYVTAKLDGVTAAARQLRTSQPSLSTQIKALEAHLGFKLFKRSGRKLQLTERGRVVLTFCQKAFDAIDDLREYVRNPKMEKAVRFVIGVSDEIERPFVTDVIGQILRGWKGAKKPSVKMMSGTHESLVGRFLIGEIYQYMQKYKLAIGRLEVIGQKPLWSQSFLFYSNQRNSESGFAVHFKRQLHKSTETFKA